MIKNDKPVTVDLDNISSNADSAGKISNGPGPHTNLLKKNKYKSLAIGLGVFGAVAATAAIAAPLIVLSRQTPSTPEGEYKITTSKSEGIKSISFTVDGKEVTTAKAGTLVSVKVETEEDYAVETLTYNGIDCLASKQFVMPKGECKINTTATTNVVYINLELNGGSAEGGITKIKLAKGSYFGYADLPEVSKTNATEGEWYLNKEMTEMITPDTKLSENTTIYKNWFNKFTDRPNCFGVHANIDSGLSVSYEDIPADTNDTPSYQKGNIDIDTLEYSFDGNTWTKFPAGSALSIPAGSNIYFSATRNLLYKGDWAYTHFVFRGEVSLGGNVMGLLDQGIGEITEVENRWFYGLFQDNSAIKAVAKDFLPAKKVGQQGYERMFAGCSKLMIAPSLPVTEVGSLCFYQMFQNCVNMYAGPETIGIDKIGYGACTEMFEECTALLIAPKLPATELEDFCYQKMFQGCTSLQNIPELLAKKVPNSGYDRMFARCSSIKTIKENALPATTIGSYCYNEMFEECTSLTNAPVLPAKSLNENCYNCMFNKCYALTTLPDKMLPSTALAAYCYNGMFQYCSSLKNMPELPATDLTNCQYCYRNMFYQSGLVAALPELPATKLAEGCYAAMFAYCEHLVAAPDLIGGGNDVEDNWIPDGAYRWMFYGCASLQSIQIGPIDSNYEIENIGDMAFEQMFENCFSLQQIKLNYARIIDTNSFRGWLKNANSNLTLAYNGSSTYISSDALPRGITIKPYSDKYIFMTALPVDLIDGEETYENVVPFTSSLGELQCYESKYGKWEGNSRHIVETGSTVGEIYDYIDEYYGTIMHETWPKPGCKFVGLEYYNGKEWKEMTSSDSTKLIKDFNVRVVFKPCKAVTMDWTSFIDAFAPCYTATTGTEFDTAVTNALSTISDDPANPDFTSLDDLAWLEREINVNGQNHRVKLVKINDDVLSEDRTGKYLQNALFTFQIITPISDENGYSLGTTYNGAATIGNSLDYANSDLRKAVDGEGDGTIRWYQKQATTATTDEKYANKSVLDMMSKTEEKIVSSMKAVNKTYKKGTQYDDYVSWSEEKYTPKLWIPSSSEMNNLSDFKFSYIMRQAKGTDGSISEITWAEGGIIPGGVGYIANVAGMNYNNDLWYGTSYWLSDAYENDDPDTEYKANNCACIMTYDGQITYEICDKWAMAVAPMFCI